MPTLPPKINAKLKTLLSQVGDMHFKRCITSILDNLDVKKGDVILDAGCGEGFYELILDELYDCSVVGIDSDPTILNSAKKWHGNKKSIRFEKQDILNLPYKSNHFDHIICSEVLEHIQNDAKAIKELYRVLKPGGSILITVPNDNYPFLWDPLNKTRKLLGLGHFSPKNIYLGGIWSYDHKRLYSVKGITKLVESAGFSVEKTKLLTKYGLPFYLLLLNLGKQFYTRLPVGDAIKNSMEKFQWKNSDTYNKTLTRKLIGSLLSVITIIDKLNNQELESSSSSMGILIKAVKD